MCRWCSPPPSQQERPVGVLHDTTKVLIALHLGRAHRSVDFFPILHAPKPSRRRVGNCSTTALMLETDDARHALKVPLREV